MLIGSNAQEGSSFVPFSPSGNGITPAVLEATTLQVIQCKLRPHAATVKRAIAPLSDISMGETLLMFRHCKSLHPVILPVSVTR